MLGVRQQPPFVTVSPDYRVRVSPRLRLDYQNGRSYYPFDDKPIRVPEDERLQPDPGYLAWHRDSVYAA